MSKNSQNKSYYEVGVLNQSTKDIIAEYVTAVRIIKQGKWVHEKLMNLMYKNHGKDIIVVWNKKDGSIPNDHRPLIKINIPKEPELKYNR